MRSRAETRHDDALAGAVPPSAPAGFSPGSFDHVLVDAPCSALGLRPRLLQTATLQYLRQCAVYQRRILDAAVQLLRPGGTLVFSTCTFNPGQCYHLLGQRPGSVSFLLSQNPADMTLASFYLCCNV